MSGIKLKAGETHLHPFYTGANYPVVHCDYGYLWFGGAQGGCIGTLSGHELRRLHDAITRVLRGDA